MKVQELRQLTPKKLWELLKKTRRDLAVTRFQSQTGREKNTADIKKQKKTVSRVLTILKEKMMFNPSEK